MPDVPGSFLLKNDIKDIKDIKPNITQYSVMSWYGTKHQDKYTVKVHPISFEIHLALMLTVMTLEVYVSFYLLSDHVTPEA